MHVEIGRESIVKVVIHQKEGTNNSDMNIHKMISSEFS